MMMKTRFGDYVRTKTLEANKTEVKIKALCHNICVLIQEAFESNIDINFKECIATISET